MLLPRDSVNDDLVEAPERQGARRAHTGGMKPTSNAADRDGSANIVAGISREEHYGTASVEVPMLPPPGTNVTGRSSMIGSVGSSSRVVSV